MGLLSKSNTAVNSAGIGSVGKAPSVKIAKNPVTKTQPEPQAVYGESGDEADEEEQEGGSSEEEHGPALSNDEDEYDTRSHRKRASIAGSAFTSGNRHGSISSRRSKSLPRSRSPSGQGYVTASENDVADGSLRKKSSLKKRASIHSGLFSAGAGTIGPDATPETDLELHTRQRMAESVLTSKQKAKIMKEEVKQGKRLSKIIQAEQKSERQSLDTAMKELAELTKVQKTAMKDESRSHTAHAETVKSFHKTELVYISARSKYESATTDLKNAEEALEQTRRHAQMVTDMVREKMREVEELRGMKRVDDRERMVKVSELRGKVPTVSST
ncbi:hypothetical protein OE88DRAFT_1085133 [Heliocybe sulcata]|uniref:Uncharacterized protein n=1 Tax=Heliocybe sulcata TaxID=5364 RepID=A0A5C3MLS5_9AGAM|nr:hypothetical protein OE88DRAFT_1085133 [Heliocybe sulcata]